MIEKIQSVNAALKAGPAPPIAPIDVWRYMEEATPWGTATKPQNFSCFRCPVIVNTGTHLVAFAEARTWTGDGCVVPAASSTPYRNFSLVMKSSPNQGATWSENTIVDVGGLNPSATYDTASGFVILHYASECEHARAMCTFQLLCTPTHCTDKMDLVAALGGSAMNTSDCLDNGNCNGVSPGPGNGVQLWDGPNKGRVLFAGHLGNTDIVW